MLFDVLWALVLVVARFLAQTSTWCEATTATTASYAVRPVSFLVSEPLHDAAIVGEDVIVVSGPQLDRHLIRSTPRSADETLHTLNRPDRSAASMRGSLGGQHLVAGARQWWYVIAGQRDGVYATTFVSGDSSGNITTSVVPATGRIPYFWIPLKGDEPRALLFSFDAAGSTVATEIDRRGAVRTWNLPMMRALLGGLSAERLPDGRIALFSNQKSDERLMLQLLDKEDKVDVALVRHGRIFQLATAVDPAGRIAVVLGLTDRTISGAVVDPEDPSRAVWRQLSDDVRLTAFAGSLQVTDTANGFVAAWIDRAEPRRLQACELKGGWAVDIGQPSGGSRDVFFALRSDSGEPTFMWDDGRNLVIRRMPASLTAYDLIERLKTFACGG